MRYILLFLFLIELILICKIFDWAKMLLSPASMFSIFFLSLMILSLCFGGAVYSGKEYSYGGYLWIQFAIIFVNVGQFLSTFIKTKKIKKEKQYRVKKNNIKAFVLFVGSLLVLIALYNYYEAGGVRNTAQYAYDYYTSSLPEESMITQIFNQLLSLVMLMVSFFAGMYLGYEKRLKRKWIAFLPLVYELINLLYSSQKLGLILASIIMFIGYIICNIYKRKRFTLRTVWKIFKKYWILIPLVLAVFILSFMLRFGVFNEYYLQESVQKLGIYAFGSPHAFNYWFVTTDTYAYTFGAETFTGIPHALGLLSRENGVYLQAVYTEFGTTNVFMSFRGLINDYGMFGSLFLMLLFGLIAGYSYKLFKYQHSKIALLMLVMSYLFTFFSFIISPFVYLNLSVFFVVYLVIREFVIRIKRKRSRKVRIPQKSVEIVSKAQL